MVLAWNLPDLMSVRDFLDWDSPPGYFWQLVDGVPLAMSPSAPVHGAIQSETIRLIGNHLLERGSPCTVIATPGVIPRFQPDRNFMVPDIAVTGFAAELTGKALHDLVLLIEILSPSNHAETWRNVWAYLTIPTPREILVIRTATIGVELLRRDDDGGWPARPLAIAGGTFTLSSIEFTLPVAALYRGSGMSGAA